MPIKGYFLREQQKHGTGFQLPARKMRRDGKPSRQRNLERDAGRNVTWTRLARFQWEGTIVPSLFLTGSSAGNGTFSRKIFRRDDGSDDGQIELLS